MVINFSVASLIIRAPYNISDETIMLIVSKHKNWINKKKMEIEVKGSKFIPKEFVNGEGFLYIGKSYKLKIVECQEEELKFDNGFCLAKSVLPAAKEIFIKWYKNEAYKKISERVERYVKSTGLKYKKVNITNAKIRWGSCSPTGNFHGDLLWHHFR